MPELPEVENVRRTLERKVQSKTIVNVEIRHSRLIKKQTPETFEDRIVNLTFRSLSRRGKFLIFTLEDPNTTNYQLISHLGMSGAWFVVSNLEEIIPAYRKHAHILFTLSDGNTLVYCDIRKFGGLRLFNDIEANQKKLNSSLLNMGPEPFGLEAREEFLERIFTISRFKNKPIKKVIMDQQCIAGIGNIYASEILFGTNIHPNTLTSALSEPEFSKIFNETERILSHSIELGGCSFSDYVNSEGETGNYQNYLKVYKKKTCPTCDQNIKTAVIASRNTFYCTYCQPEK